MKTLVFVLVLLSRSAFCGQITPEAYAALDQQVISMMHTLDNSRETIDTGISILDIALEESPPESQAKMKEAREFYAKYASSLKQGISETNKEVGELRQNQGNDAVAIVELAKLQAVSFEVLRFTNGLIEAVFQVNPKFGHTDAKATKLLNTLASVLETIVIDSNRSIRSVASKAIEK